MCTGALGVNHPLRDALTVKVCEFLNQVNVLKQHRPSLASGE
jgi:hypothetical protein